MKSVSWDKMIDSVQGPLLGRCDASDHQRALLLEILLAYHALSRDNTTVDPELYYVLAGHLVEIVELVELAERVDGHLEELVAGIRSSFPEVRLMLISHVSWTTLVQHARTN